MLQIPCFQWWIPQTCSGYNKTSTCFLAFFLCMWQVIKCHASSDGFLTDMHEWMVTQEWGKCEWQGPISRQWGVESCINTDSEVTACAHKYTRATDTIHSSHARPCHLGQKHPPPTLCLAKWQDNRCSTEADKTLWPAFSGLQTVSNWVWYPTQWIRSDPQQW